MLCARRVVCSLVLPVTALQVSSSPPAVSTCVIRHTSRGVPRYPSASFQPVQQLRAHSRMGDAPGVTAVEVQQSLRQMLPTLDLDQTTERAVSVDARA